MHKILIFFILTISFNLLANELDKKEAYQKAKVLIENIRSNFKEINMTQEIDELENIIQEEKLDISKFGFGRGVLPYWRRITAKNIVKTYENICTNSGLELKSFKNLTPISNDKLLTFKTHGEFNITVLSKEKVQEVFQSVYSISNKLISEEFGNRCESRAHAISILLDKMCITSAKAFIESEKISINDHKWWWLYHVAPIVMVDNGGKIEPYIFDHSIFKKAVPLKVWIEKLRFKNPENPYHVFFTNRFNLLPESRDDIKTNYSPADIEEADYRLFKGWLLRIARPFLRPL